MVPLGLFQLNVSQGKEIKPTGSDTQKSLKLRETNDTLE
jgi:hypothetical protein